MVLSSPGLIVALGLIVVAALRTLAALAARPKFIEMNRLFDELMASPELSPAERRRAIEAMELATSPGRRWAIALLAPAFVLPIVVVAIVLALSRRKRREFDAMLPSNPSDRRLYELEMLATPAGLLNTPFLSAWSALFLAIPLGLVVWALVGKGSPLDISRAVITALLDRIRLVGGLRHAH